jgi:hypothetical protein
MQQLMTHLGLEADAHTGGAAAAAAAPDTSNALQPADKRANIGPLPSSSAGAGMRKPLTAAEKRNAAVAATKLAQLAKVAKGSQSISTFFSKK